MKNKIAIFIIYLVAAGLYILGPQSLIKGCEVGDSPMKCYWSIQAVAVLAIVLLGITLLYLLTLTSRERTLLSTLAALTGVIAFLIPKVIIGGCSMKTMGCQSITFPAFYVISIVLFLVSVINIIYQLRKNEGKN